MEDELYMVMEIVGIYVGLCISVDNIKQLRYNVIYVIQWTNGNIS